MRVGEFGRGFAVRVGAELPSSWLVWPQRFSRMSYMNEHEWHPSVLGDSAGRHEPKENFDNDLGQASLAEWPPARKSSTGVQLSKHSSRLVARGTRSALGGMQLMLSHVTHA